MEKQRFSLQLYDQIQNILALPLYIRNVFVGLQVSAHISLPPLSVYNNMYVLKNKGVDTTNWARSKNNELTQPNQTLQQ